MLILTAVMSFSVAAVMSFFMAAVMSFSVVSVMTAADIRLKLQISRKQCTDCFICTSGHASIKLNSCLR